MLKLMNCNENLNLPHFHVNNNSYTRDSEECQLCNELRRVLESANCRVSVGQIIKFMIDFIHQIYIKFLNILRFDASYSVNINFNIK